MSQETHDPFADFLENLGVNYQEYRPLNDFVKIGGILKEYFTEPESVHTERRIRAALSGDKRILWESPRKPYFGTAPRERMITLEPDGDTINFKLSSRGKDIVFGEDGKVEWNRYFEPEFDSPKKHEIWETPERVLERVVGCFVSPSYTPIPSSKSDSEFLLPTFANIVTSGVIAMINDVEFEFVLDTENFQEGAVISGEFIMKLRPDQIDALDQI